MTAMIPAAPMSQRQDYAAGLEAGVKGLRIGLVRHFYAQDCDAHPEQIAALDRAAEVLRHSAPCADMRLAPLEQYATATRIIIRCEAFAIHRRGCRATRRLRRPGAPAHSRWGHGKRGRLHRRPAPARSPDAPDAGGLCRHRRGLDRLEHGSDLPDRRCRGLRQPVSAPGAPALQRHGTAGTRHARGLYAATGCRFPCSSSAIPSRRPWSTGWQRPTSAPRRGPSATRQGCERAVNGSV